MEKKIGFQKKCDKCGYFMLFSHCFNCESANYKYKKKNKESYKSDNVFNLGIISLLIFFISFFLPFYNLGINGVTPWDILTVTSNFHVDVIGIFVLIAGAIMLIYNVDMNVIKIATIIGICFPLNRLFRIATIDVDIPTSFAPSFGIGGYLILIGAGIQLYACFSSTNENDTIEKNVAEPQKESNPKEDENTSNTDSTDNENSSDDIDKK